MQTCYFYFLENLYLNIIWNVIILPVYRYNKTNGCSILLNLETPFILRSTAGWKVYPLVTKPRGSWHPSPGLCGGLMLTKVPGLLGLVPVHPSSHIRPPVASHDAPLPYFHLHQLQMPPQSAPVLLHLLTGLK